MWVENAKEVGLLNIFCLLSSGTHLLYQPCAILKEFEEFALFQELLVIMKPKNTCSSSLLRSFPQNVKRHVVRR